MDDLRRDGDDDDDVATKLVDDVAVSSISRPHSIEKASNQAIVESATDAKAENDAKAKDVKPADYLVVGVTISGPGPVKPITIEVIPPVLVSEIIQPACERPEVCYRTCFSVFVNGREVELSDIVDFNDGKEIHIIEKPYNVAEVNTHLKHVADLLHWDRRAHSSSLVNDIPMKLKKFSAPFKMTRDCLPPDWILPNQETDGVSLAHMFSDRCDVTASTSSRCVLDLWYSRWDPPPPERRIRGDLAYLVVTRLDGVAHHITATSSGFFLNKCTNTVFDPTPAESPYNSYTLIGLLSQVIPSFKKAFDRIFKMTKNADPLNLMPSSLNEDCSWINVQQPHYPGVNTRVQDNLRYCQGRSWTEEILRVKDLTPKTVQENVVKIRYLETITKEFLSFATDTAVAAVEGEISAPFLDQERKDKVYLWNNVVLSYVADIKEIFTDEGAAEAAARADFNINRLLNNLNLDKVQPFLMTLVCHRGHTVLVASVIPGFILPGDKEYSPLKSGKNESLEKFCEVLRLRPHKVQNEEGDALLMRCPSDVSGVIGSDGRLYLTNMYRMYVPDVNFLHVPRVENPFAKEEEKDDDSEFEFPVHTHKILWHRMELVEAFVESKHSEFMKAIAVGFTEAIKSKQETGDKSYEKDADVCAEKKEEIEEEEEEKMTLVRAEDPDDHQTTPTTNQFQAVEIDGAESVDIVAKAASRVGSSCSTDFSICFNPDIYSSAKLADTEEELHKDKFMVQEVSDFLLNTILKKIVESMEQLNVVIYDGQWLSSVLHSGGVNIRYMGKLAVDIEKNSKLSYVFKIAICEMLGRSAKHILRTELQKVPESQLAMSAARFLNCVVGSCGKFPHQPRLGETLFPGSTNPSKKSKNKKQKDAVASVLKKGDPSWVSLTPTKLWKKLVEEVKAYFGYSLDDCLNVGDAVAKYGISRIGLLRRVCQFLGIQIVAKNYDFKSTTRPPFDDEDVLRFFPLVRTIHAADFDQTVLGGIWDTATKQLASGNTEVALELLVDLLPMCESVYGPFFSMTVSIHRLLAKISFSQQNVEQAIVHQRKTVLILERMQGVDDPETINAYIYLGLYCNAAGLTDVALKLLYRARYLGLVLFGNDHPSLAELDKNIGAILLGVKEFQSALAFAQNSLKIYTKFYGSDSDKVAASHHLVARVLANLGDYRSAIDEERQTLSIYSEKNPNDERVQTSSAVLNVLTHEAVRMQRQVNEMKGVESVSTKSLRV
ncbi:clustered mitochondria protein homolog isoform X3 [Oscarella lobularis]|uniref:clustered mitochondria protein homolog isoform X3 n=1 Tax=Oscarella lobularis TaxID=121494 RepID=UPI003313A8AE